MVKDLITLIGTIIFLVAITLFWVRSGTYKELFHVERKEKQEEDGKLKDFYI